MITQKDQILNAAITDLEWIYQKAIAAHLNVLILSDLFVAMIFTFKKLNNTKSCARHELSAYIMLTYNGNKLKFVAYSEIENLHG